MKAAKKPKIKAKTLQKRGGESADTTGVQKSSKRISQEIKAVNIEDDLKNIHCLVNRTNTTEMVERSTLLHLYPTQMLNPRTKIKLQLFPVNEEIRTALEKDGYLPHLELTLRAQKKISSVLNHLISKWGRSSVACGELMLFPYSKLSSLLNGPRWTLNDSEISAGDVYAAVGNPSIFRLRYGWVSTSIPFEFHLPSQGKDKYCGSTVPNMHEEGIQFEEMLDRCKSSNVNDVNNTAASEKIVAFPINPTDNEPPVDSGFEQSSKSLMLDIDLLPNISIGGLLSEVSLMGKCSNWDSKETGSIAAQINFSEVSKQTNNDQHSSIFDTEETRHAFSVKKLSSSRKDALSSDAIDGGIIQEASSTSNSFRFPKTFQVHSRSELSQDQESKTRLDDENSLGLSEIKWNDSDSCRPFGLVSGKASSGDGFSMSGFVQ